MSEYQWVEFRAVDAPLDDKALAFMRRQSTRAEIDRWKFVNEYNFGDFHGKTLEMMRRGYDVHVHYANFGLRHLSFRIPHGAACLDQLDSYLLGDEIRWKPDAKGAGGVLTLEPDGDAGTWDWLGDVESLASAFIPLRDMLVAGDMRPLYIAHIAFLYEDDALEPPVPAGLRKTHPALQRLCEFYEIPPDLITVAAESSVDLKPEETVDALIASWLKMQSKADALSALEKCLHEPHQYPLRLLRRIRLEATESGVTCPGNRTIGELRSRAQQMAAERKRKKKATAERKDARRKAKADREHQEKLAAIAANPGKSLKRIDAAVAEKTKPAYVRAAAELALLAEACGMPTAIAKVRSIRREFRYRTALLSELKKAGF
ncbi:MAG: hypothetical protein KDA61_09500 [Planctomycetales bacterium]|nr:hypothetical protein [Planctomycetales bacterium]